MTASSYWQNPISTPEPSGDSCGRDRWTSTVCPNLETNATISGQYLKITGPRGLRLAIRLSAIKSVSSLVDDNLCYVRYSDVAAPQPVAMSFDDLMRLIGGESDATRQ